MSIRRTIEGLLQDPADHAAFRDGPEAFFADRGMGDLPSELIGASFGHFSDTAPIEQSDAVAGIATRFSPVPFEESDLPDFDPDAGTVDPFATLGVVDDLDTLDDLTPPDDLAAADDAAPHDAAHLDHDGTDEHRGATNEGADEPDHPSADDDQPDDGFGSGGLGGQVEAGDEIDDDPFYDEVTSEDSSGFVGYGSAAVATGNTPTADVQAYETADEVGYETFPEDDLSAFDDVDPALELDDI